MLVWRASSTWGRPKVWHWHCMVLELHSRQVPLHGAGLDMIFKSKYLTTFRCPNHRLLCLRPFLRRIVNVVSTDIHEYPRAMRNLPLRHSTQLCPIKIDKTFEKVLSLFQNDEKAVVCLCPPSATISKQL